MIRYEKFNIDTILNTDFNVNTTASYSELLLYINELKRHYKECVDNFNHQRNREYMYNQSLDNLTEKITELENSLKYFVNVNNNLTFALTRKLTWWERITGKIKI